LLKNLAEATSEAQDIAAFTAVLSTVLFADCIVEPFFNKLLKHFAGRGKGNCSRAGAGVNIPCSLSERGKIPLSGRHPFHS
jgi:hypothetical protein